MIELLWTAVVWIWNFFTRMPETKLTLVALYLGTAWIKSKNILVVFLIHSQNQVECFKI